MSLFAAACRLKMKECNNLQTSKKEFHRIVVKKYYHCPRHTIYPGNNMCQKCGRKSGLWVLHEIVNKTYAENMKQIVGAVWELPAK